MASIQTGHLETDWDNAPGLTEGALNVPMSPERCTLPYWIDSVAQGTWQGLVNGHKPETETPAIMCRPGPLRDSIIEEFGFRSIGEEIAARTLSYLVINAPDIPRMEFYITQSVDEARHASVFRGHLLEVGVPEDELRSVIDAKVGDMRRAVLDPLEDWILGVIRDQGDFIGGVVIFTILVEGVLAPAAEISEHKWRRLDPAAAEIEHGANIDEIRHLAVGANIVKQHLDAHPESRDRIQRVIDEGKAVWESLPTQDVVLQRERLFQQGMEDHAEIVGDYELTDGIRLIDTTPEDRLKVAEDLQHEMQEGRLAYMGLQGAM